MQPKRPPLKTPLFQQWREMLDGDSELPVADRDSTRRSLEAADEAYARAKLSNREAIRRMNRQVRIPGRHTPNIILIVAEDLGIGELGTYGQTKIKTPYLDWMAAHGVRFAQHYAGDSTNPPSLDSLHTGRHTGVATIRGEAPEVALHSADCTLAETLYQAGYTTSAVGEWELGGPNTAGAPWRQGFESFYGRFRNDDDVVYPRTIWRNNLRVLVMGNDDQHNIVRANRLFMAEALEILAVHHLGHREPFFLYVAYDRGLVPEVEPFYKDLDWTDAQKQYATAISRLDNYVGQILRRLNKYGMDQDTIVVFTANNGPVPGPELDFFGSTRGLKGAKGSLNEGGLRVPLIIYAPRYAREGSVVAEPTAAWDLLPTLAGLAGAQLLPPQLTGMSLVPALQRQALKGREVMYWEHFGTPLEQAVRLGYTKGLHNVPAGAWQLFDLGEDQREEKDLAADHAKVVDKMEEAAHRMRVPSAEFPSPALDR